MRLMNMLKICLAFRKSKPQYACKRYAYKKTCIMKDFFRATRTMKIVLEISKCKMHSVCFFYDKIFQQGAVSTPQLP